MPSNDPTKPLAEVLAANWVRTQPTLLAYLCSALSDLSLAEDVAQEVAVAATRQFTQEQADKPFTPWVMGIARRQVALYYRKHYRDRLKFDSDVLAQIEDVFVENEQEIAQRRSILDQCIAELNPKARRLIEFRYAAGLKTREIAERVGTTSNTVAVTMSRIRKALTDCVSRQMDGGAR
ncbi:MAG: sigma-70 family RNA polymerase sigma factor [Planctomycetota bacterium]